MAESPTLFDTSWRPVETVAGLARYGDPQTSADAAKSITGRTERAILALLQRHDEWDGGWTADEIAESLTDIYKPTLVSALSRLANHNLIADTGLTRPSNRGRESTVWKLST